MLLAKKDRPINQFTVSLLLLDIVFIALVAAGVFGRGRLLNRPLVQAATFAFVLCVMSAAAWRISFPQQNTDFDTWAELSRFRLGRTWELIKQHRPLQYYLEYWYVRGMRHLLPDLRQCLAALNLVAFGGLVVLLVRFRSTLFRSQRLEFPLIAGVIFILTPGGEFLFDSWNDHLSLAPFYLAGLVCILRFGEEPRLWGTAALGVFAAESMLHSAEPWLWAVGLVAWLTPGRRTWPATIFTLALMAALSFALLSCFPGGERQAANYLSGYAQKVFSPESGRVYANAWERGGPFALRARLLVPSIAIFLLLAAFATFRRTHPRRLAWFIAITVALCFPVIYEANNPERYWTICLLFSIGAGRVFRDAGTLVGNAAKRAESAVSSRHRKAAILGIVFATGSILCFGVLGMIREWRDRDEEALHNGVAQTMLTPEFKKGILLVGSPYVYGGPPETFYLWQEYWFPGRVAVLDDGEMPAVWLRAEKQNHASTTIYLNSPAIHGLNDSTSSATVTEAWHSDGGLKMYQVLSVP